MFKLSVSKKTIVSFTRINSVIIAGLFRPEQNYQWSFSETLFYLRMKNWNSNHLIIWIFESLTRQCQIYELINLKNTKKRFRHLWGESDKITKRRRIGRTKSASLAAAHILIETSWWPCINQQQQQQVSVCKLQIIINFSFFRQSDLAIVGLI